MLARAEYEPNTDCAAPAAVEAIDYTTAVDRQAYCAAAWEAIRAEDRAACAAGRRVLIPVGEPQRTKREAQRAAAAAWAEQKRANERAALALVD